MIDRLIENILDFLIKVFVYPQIVTVLIAALPIVEARLAMPIGLGLKLDYFQSWLFAFIGSSMLAPLLLLVLIPFIKWLSKTRIFRKIGTALYDKFVKDESVAISSSALGDEAERKAALAEEKAEKRADELVSEARRQAEKEAEKILDAARSGIADAVALAAEKIIADMGTSSDGELYDKFLAEAARSERK